MPSLQVSPPAAESARSAYQQALLQTRPRWQTLVFLFTGLILSFLVPAIALCGWLSQSQIVWAIAGTTLATGLGYLGAGRLLEGKSARDRRVDDLLLSGTLMIASALLMFGIAAQSGPMQGRKLEFWPSLTIALVAALVGACIMRGRAKRLASRCAVGARK